MIQIESTEKQITLALESINSLHYLIDAHWMGYAYM